MQKTTEMVPLTEAELRLVFRLIQKEPESVKRRFAGRRKERLRRGREERIRHWEPSAPPYNDQLSAYNSTQIVQYVSGGNRSGKTELSVAKSIHFATGVHPVLSKIKKPPVYGRYCGTTWEDGIKGVIIKKFQAMVRRCDLYGGSWDTAWGEKSRTLTFCLNGDQKVKGSVIRFFTYVQKVSSYGGDALDWVVMDEHGAYPFFTENIARLVDRGGWLMLTETPELGITWEDKEILQRYAAQDEDYGVWLFSSKKNKYLSKEGLAALIKTIGDDEELYKTKILGIMSVLSGRILPMFKENIHVIDDFEIPKNKRWHRQIILDPHKRKDSAILWLAWDKEGDCFVYREASWSPNRAGIKDLANLIRVKSAGDGEINDWIMDEALGGSPKPGEVDAFGMEGFIDQLNKEGLPFVGTNINSSKAVEAGIIKMRQFLNVDPITCHTRLKIFRSCPQLIRQMMIYQYRKSTPADEQQYREMVRKIEDDFVDCLRYGLMAEPPMGMGPRIIQEYDSDSGAPIVGVGYQAPDIAFEV